MQGEWLKKPAGSASVVFVHGILSSGEECWRNKNGAYWPDLLAQEPTLSALGIYVYTYQTGVFSGSYSISDIVDDLKERLRLDKVLSCKQLIFVCHSMGGIVVRKYLVERILDITEYNPAIGLFLVASPSLGSDYANYISLLTAWVGHAQAQTLGFSQQNDWLNDLDKEFKNLKERKTLQLSGKELIEDKPIVLKKSFFQKQVVEPFSAARYFGEPYKVPGSDHSSIAKPENISAIQHRLLVELIEKICPSGEMVSVVKVYGEKAEHQSFDPHIFPINKAEADWQEKLIQRLTEQLQQKEIEEITTSFANKLREDFAELPLDWHDVARYLVMGHGDRHKQIQQFLKSAQQVMDKHPTQLKEDLIKNLMAYLLQILVRKCFETDDQGLTRIPVEEIHTVKLVGATRSTCAYIPNVSRKDEQEHENGQRNAAFQNIGHFLPETGELDNVDNVCQAIAQDLLLSLGESTESKGNESVDKLKRLLSAYSYDPENAPLQGLYVKQDIVNNPLKIDAVASGLRRMLGDVLWIYIYGGRNPAEWLYTEEGQIEGLISRYNRDVVKQKTASQNPNDSIAPKVAKPSHYSVFISYSHADAAFVSNFVEQLKQPNLQVVIDKTHLQPGENITQFIQRAVKETDATICMVSKSSLLSSWVARETINTFQLQQWSDSKKFIACFWEEDFFRPAFRLEATKIINQKIEEIEHLIPEYQKERIDTNDLNDDKTRLYQLRNDLGDILKRLKESFSLDIKPENLENSLEQLRQYFKID